MTDTAKKRVSSLAKSYDISSDLLLKLLKDIGEDVKSASSMIDQPTFLRVKPLLAAEKERQERDELIKAGKKIPMKAVIKKVPAPPPPTPAAVLAAAAAEKAAAANALAMAARAEAQSVEKIEAPAPTPVAAPKPEIPVVKPVEVKPVEAKPELVQPVITPKVIVQPAAIVEQPPVAREIPPEIPKVVVEAKAVKPVEVVESKIEAKPAEPIPSSKAPEAKIEPPAKPMAKAETAQKVQLSAEEAKAIDLKSMTSAQAEAKARSIYQELKVSVEQPDAALLARIARSKQDTSRRRGDDRTTQGYSGHLTRQPGAPTGPSQGGYGARPGGPTNPGGQGGAGGGQGGYQNRGPGGPGGGQGGYGGNRGPGGPGGAGGGQGGYGGNRGPGGPGSAAGGQGGYQNRGPGGPGGGQGGYGGNRGPGGPGGAAGGQGGYQNRGPGGPGGGQGGYGGNRGPGGPGGAAGGQGGYQNRGPGGPGGGQGGYGGNRGPGGQGGTGGPRSFDGPRDVFAIRAQQAGILTGPLAGLPPRGDNDRDRNRGTGGSGGGAPGGAPAHRRSSNHRRKSKEQVEQELLEARNNVTKVMASLSKTPGKRNFRDRREEEELGPVEKQILQVADYVTIGELAGLMNALPAKVIAKCMEMGMMVTINQRLDHEMIALVAGEFGFEAKLMDEYSDEQLGTADEAHDDPESLQPRAPIITVMGHVDHGKTSILDFYRKTSVVAGESGGITQHIGAYRVNTPQGPICFLDTPGHEAFSAMRARGAVVTDVVLLVVAADSMVMPQTKEAIQLAKNSNCGIVVALNKADLPTSNPDKIKTQLAEAGVQVEEWGGTVPCIEVSAKTGNNMDKLLETLALASEILELKANPDRPAMGTVIESRLDKGKGPVATVLVQTGTLRVGDPFVTGIYAARVRALLDERGKSLQEAGPSTPVQVLGLEAPPQSGDTFVVVESESEGREIAARRRLAAKDRELRQKRHITLDQLNDQIKSGEFHELKVIIKGDVDGSVEAIAAMLEKTSTKEVRIVVISKGVGAVKEADIQLAVASDALVIAFHVLPSESVRNLAEREGVTINHYRIIYDVVDDIKAAMEGMLSPEVREEVAGEAEILKIFKIKGVGIIAGCKVGSGIVEKELKARIYRNGIEVAEAKVVSLKREKDDVKQVKSGFECGIGLDNAKDVREGDVIAFFRKVEVARKLTPVTA